MTKWYDESGIDGDVVISSRVRIARNLENIKFPQEMTLEDSEIINNKVLGAIERTDEHVNYDYYKIKELSSLDRNVFVEEHLISPNLIKDLDRSSFFLRKDEKATIMVNEEDHLRIQTLMTGLKLDECWTLCSEIDDSLEETLDFAFDEKFGYLTSCPTNTGTGLRASVMIHLPCLVYTGYANNIFRAVSQIGLTVRGLYGEGTTALGNIFQISNQTTLGETEEEIIQKLKNVVIQIIDKEREMRNNLLVSKKYEVEDKLYRSLGILKYGRIMSSEEAMNLLSYVKMGIEMGIIKNIDAKEITNLMILIQPASLQKYFDREMDLKERQIKRAELIRGKL
ncbi:protein arginine kinase [Anaerosalibacter sp. Marseille-P3206]|uniref:protein arginine kinase n=1 Tax=Anaerosalibacter sp. Marseille-P3206 TaxID=1871005 RepID=UPI000984A9C0|nr:protein arginine kinase [Anaerosalibacter sp. Marseille-P3206]